ncbi:MAG: LemA family protein [Candidatus Shapirobacteria bacterium]
MIIGLIILAVVIFYVFGTYNRFITLKTRIKASIQEIGNQLKRQAELIPNLAKAADKYLQHEKEILKTIANARTLINQAAESGEAKKIFKAQETLQKALGSVRVVVESNPELKAAGTIVKLMDNLTDTSDKIMYARRTLIDLSADYNRQVLTVPSNFIAKIFGFKQEKGLSTPLDGSHISVSSEDLKTPKI